MTDADKKRENVFHNNQYGASVSLSKLHRLGLFPYIEHGKQIFRVHLTIIKKKPPRFYPGRLPFTMKTTSISFKIPVTINLF